MGTDGPSAGLQHQTESPFYFKAVDVASKAYVFLKVWKSEDANLKSIQKELRLLGRAQACGVPVAARAVDDVLISDVDGSRYYVMATEFVEGGFPNQNDEREFIESLIESVEELHT